VESTPSRAEARTIARLRNELVRAEQLVVRPAEAERLLDISHKTLYRLMNYGEHSGLHRSSAREISEVEAAPRKRLGGCPVRLGVRWRLHLAAPAIPYPRIYPRTKK
jgi:hypothetical protein